MWDSNGVLCLEAYHAKVPGILRNASTFKFPVLYKVVMGASIDRLINQQDPSLLAPFIEAVRELEQEGVHHHRELRIHGSFSKGARRGGEHTRFHIEPDSGSYGTPHAETGPKGRVLTARKGKLTGDHLRAVGAESVPVCIAGMDDKEEFCETIIFGRKKEMDLDRLEKEVLSVIDHLAKENPDMGALVIAFADLPPFAHLIQEKVHIPIFDIVTLTNMVYEAVVRTSYQGIMPR